MKIGIIGAGASGMFAAITAARQGADVVLIEKKDRIGKKILATGNGKCNFTNTIMGEKDYHSKTENIFEKYIQRFDNEQVLSFFRQQGMLIKDRNGYCYPRSEQAATVLDILRCCLKAKGIRIFTESCPISIQAKKKGFEVLLDNKKKLCFDKLILACGSLAGEKQKDDYNGYTYAKMLGHSIVPVVPALVQVRAKGKEFKSIAGVRCEAKIQLFTGKKKIVEEQGELQLTDYGISGIPVFQLSRYVAYGVYEKKSMYAIIDFLPEYDEEQWKTIVSEKWKHADKDISVEEFFTGFLNKKLNMMFLKSAGLKPEGILKEYSWEKIWKACSLMKQWKIELEGTNPYENAQVCAGGVSLEEVTAQLESKLVKGLFFAGELLDVDGRCGGYNLQWAWTSGYLAGKYASLP